MYDLRYVKPLDDEVLKEIGARYDRGLTVEDGTELGGAGSAVMEWLVGHGYGGRLSILGTPDRFVAQGSIEELHREVGLDEEGVRRRMKSLIEP